MKVTAFWIYRILYCAALALLFVVLVRRLPIGESLRRFEVPLYYALVASVMLALVPGIAFRRIPEWASWAMTLFLSIMFIWWGWFSLGAPFVLHELHTFDPVEAAREVNSYRTQALSGTVGTVCFFMLLPVLRHWMGSAAISRKDG
ncbi:MAG: hypothetical protein WAM79_01710 [Candidatus Sulfotelmatobacter sp.]